jgi:hypothetical protein
MAKKIADKIPAGLELDMLTAEKVFGWKNIHAHEATLVGKKQDRAGRWRRAKVPRYSTSPTDAFAIEERMEQLGLQRKYFDQLNKITRVKKLPSEWATPDQRCRAALKAVGTQS